MKTILIANCVAVLAMTVAAAGETRSSTEYFVVLDADTPQSKDARPAACPIAVFQCFFRFSIILRIAQSKLKRPGV
jgi:hypothetical protein